MQPPNPPNPPIPAGARAYRVSEVVDGVEYMGYVNSPYLLNNGERGIAQRINRAPQPNVVRLLAPPYVQDFVDNQYSTATFFNITHYVPSAELTGFFENPANLATITALTPDEREVIRQRAGGNAANRRLVAMRAYLARRGRVRPGGAGGGAAGGGAAGGGAAVGGSRRKSVRKNKKRQSRKYK